MGCCGARTGNDLWQALGAESLAGAAHQLRALGVVAAHPATPVLAVAARVGPDQPRASLRPMSVRPMRRRCIAWLAVHRLLRLHVPAPKVQGARRQCRDRSTPQHRQVRLEAKRSASTHPWPTAGACDHVELPRAAPHRQPHRARAATAWARAASRVALEGARPPARVHGRPGSGQGERAHHAARCTSVSHAKEKRLF